MTPQQAFYANKKSVPINEALGKISAELVMAYPPGIPILAPGERLTSEIIDYIRYAKEKGCVMTGTKDMEMNNIETVEE
jgi:lysine decarboxylase